MSKIKFIAIILIILSVNSCAITKYENYRFLGFGASIGEKPDKNYTSVNISIDNSLFEYKKTGILRKKLIYKEPYSYYFSICGNFDKIENLQAYFIQNKTKKINIPLSEKDLKREIGEKLSLCSNNYIFSYEKKLQLPITWHETDTLEAEVNFVGIENGIRKKYKLIADYEKEAIIENTNLTWDAIMGI